MRPVDIARRLRGSAGRAAAWGGLVALAACVRAPRPVAVPPAGGGPQRIVRIALQTATNPIDLGGTDDWRLIYESAGSVIDEARSRDHWTIERDARRVRAGRVGGATPAGTYPGTLIARPTNPESFITVDGKRYRGDIVLLATDSGVLVVNRLPLEGYLRGVVPLEIGERSASERAAVEAQAVAARSYALGRIADRTASSPAAYDLLASTSDQVYGGRDGESAQGDAAVARTAGLVILYGGRVVAAVYHSTCGGSTADARELWQTGGEPYLRPVSDRIPGTDRYYCDISPRFAWSRTLDAKMLNDAAVAYLPVYAQATGDVGKVKSVEVAGRTASGRAAAITVVTDRGRYTVRGNNMRYVLRSPGGDVLASTNVQIEDRFDANGDLEAVSLSGTGNGHGVGMCQWGAIGRARAGQDFRTILRTYFPGTEVGPLR